MSRVTPARTRRDTLSAAVVGLAIAALVGACVGQASPAPPSPVAVASPSPPAVSHRPQPTRKPDPTARPNPPSDSTAADLGCADLIASKPPLNQNPDRAIQPPPSPTIAGSNAASRDTIEKAAAALAGLRSYRFSVDTVGMNIPDLMPTTLDFSLLGTVSHANGFAMDTQMGFRMREPDGSAAISSGARYVVGDGYVWGSDDLSGVLEPSGDESTIAGITILTPEGLMARVIVPFAGGYERIGTGAHGGIQTVHLRATKAGAKAYQAAFHFDAPMIADVWIALAGGELVAARITGEASHIDERSGQKVDDSIFVQFEVTDRNKATNVVDLPVIPVPDPVRPRGPRVNFKIQYQVMPADGVAPTAADLDEIGVTLRYRLEVYTRPVKVDLLGQDGLVITVCDTTSADADRRTILATGAMNVVPLPASEYGSKAHPGPNDLPTVGSQIDSTLAPITPAARLGLARTHVDPETGRRGIAFVLGNKEGDAFRLYAGAHAGEFVAIVFDGVVLATLPIEGETAKGNIAFTGDYTEAESRSFANALTRDPVRFVLKPVIELEVPVP